MSSFELFDDVVSSGKKYSCILADPPWSFKSWSDKGKNRSPDFMVDQKGLAERHYATMTMEDIVDLPVQSVTSDNCALFLWVVDCQLPECIEVGKSWGFDYKTVGFTWTKTSPVSDGYHIGLGYWTRGNPEMCLLFARGAPRRKSASVRQLVVSKRREHSRKPDEIHERIEQLVDGPYLELFGRQQRPGWDVFGNQVGCFDLPVATPDRCHYKGGLLL